MTITLFTADDYVGDGNLELWATDGTAAGTYKVKEINPARFTGSNPGGNSAGPFAVLNGYAYFSANDGTHGTQLWRSDGTLGGTVQVSNLASGHSFANIQVSNGSLYYQD